jgi:hypothetical protein
VVSWHPVSPGMALSWFQAPVIRHFLAAQVSVVAFLPVKVFSQLPVAAAMGRLCMNAARPESLTSRPRKMAAAGNSSSPLEAGVHRRLPQSYRVLGNTGAPQNDHALELSQLAAWLHRPAQVLIGPEQEWHKKKQGGRAPLSEPGLKTLIVQAPLNRAPLPDGSLIDYKPVSQVLVGWRSSWDDLSQRVVLATSGLLGLMVKLRRTSLANTEFRIILFAHRQPSGVEPVKSLCVSQEPVGKAVKLHHVSVAREGLPPGIAGTAIRPGCC